MAASCPVRGGFLGTVGGAGSILVSRVVGSSLRGSSAAGAGASGGASIGAGAADGPGTGMWTWSILLPAPEPLAGRELLPASDCGADAGAFPAFFADAAAVACFCASLYIACSSSFTAAASSSVTFLQLHLACFLVQPRQAVKCLTHCRRRRRHRSQGGKIISPLLSVSVFCSTRGRCTSVAGSPGSTTWLSARFAIDLELEAAVRAGAAIGAGAGTGAGAGAAVSTAG